MTVQDFFTTNNTMLIDGATGSQLIAHGLQAGDCPEMWNIDHSDIVQSINRGYFEAGSDAVLTNTFGGSKIKLKSSGLEEKTYELNLAGAQNAQAVRPEGKFVIASIGPSGAMLEPFGEVSEEEMTESFAIQAKALADAGVDAFLIETFTDLNEMKCALNAVKQENKNKHPIITSFTFNETPDGFYTMMGNKLEDVVQEMLNEEVFAIGSNCGNGLENMIGIGKALRNTSNDLRILIKPNAGEPEYDEGEICYPEDPEFFRKKGPQLLELNPSFIGGCCGTSPEYIKVLRELIDQQKR